VREGRRRPRARTVVGRRPTTARTPQPAAGRFIILTGLSGAGKSQAIRALEDLGYFCVDNLPTPLMATLVALSRRPETEMAKVAVIVDVRERAFLSRFPRVFRQLRAGSGLKPVLIFLEASDAALVRRFSETRRPHPVAPDRSPIEGIHEERVRLAPIRRLADHIIDTSDMTVHELRRAFMELSKGRQARRRLVVTLASFGFKHGVPVDCDLLFDVRFLPNPHFVPGLRARTGREPAVARYLGGFPATVEFLEKSMALLAFLVPQFVAEGKSYLTIGIGCTGGRHRSVAIAEALGEQLARLRAVRVRVKHRDIAAD
jgi:UPF0042 nucleotide-binding protein